MQRSTSSPIQSSARRRAATFLVLVACDPNCSSHPDDGEYELNIRIDGGGRVDVVGAYRDQRVESASSCEPPPYGEARSCGPVFYHDVETLTLTARPWPGFVLDEAQHGCSTVQWRREPGQEEWRIVIRTNSREGKETCYARFGPESDPGTSSETTDDSATTGFDTTGFDTTGLDTTGLDTTGLDTTGLGTSFGDTDDTGGTTGGGPSDCCSAHDGLGCDDDVCSTFVCEEYGVYTCCEDLWDEYCAMVASDFCNVCTGG